MANVNGLLMDDDFVRRMRNWARTAAGMGGAVRAMDYARDVSGGGYRETAMPFMEGEARDTEAALATLALALQQPVRQFWEREGFSWAEHGERGGCDYRTFRSRVEDGHVLLQAELYRRTALWREVGRVNRERCSTVQIPVDKANVALYDKKQYVA